MENFTLNFKEQGYEETIRRIYEEDYIGKHLSVLKLKEKYGYGSFYEAFKRYGLKTRDDREKTLKYSCDSHFFDVIDTEEKAYWLGFISADGYITKHKNSNRRVGISLNTNDREHLAKFLKAINCNAPIHDYEVKSSGYKIGAKYSRIIVIDEILAQGLINCGCIEHKTDRLEYPKPEILPKELERHYIRGYFDGDGSLVKLSATSSGWSVGICSTEDILLHIDNYMFNNGIFKQLHTFTKRKPEHITTNLKVGGRGIVKRFCDHIYKDATVYLDRKYYKYLLLLKDIEERNKSA